MIMKETPSEVRVLVVINDVSAEGSVIDVDLFLEDGSAAYFYENGGSIRLVLHQSRLREVPGDYPSIWSELAKGKMYIKEFEGVDCISEGMIREALNWLKLPNDGFSLIQVLSSEYEPICEIVRRFLNKESMPKENVDLFPPKI